MSETAKEAKPLPWWVFSSRRRPGLPLAGIGLTTVAPFWRAVHLVNLVALIYFKYIEWRQQP